MFFQVRLVRSSLLKPCRSSDRLETEREEESEDTPGLQLGFHQDSLDSLQMEEEDLNKKDLESFQYPQHPLVVSFCFTG